MPAEEYCYLGEIEEWELYRADHEADPENHSPTFTEEELARIFAITNINDITTVELGSTWEDDHEICVNVTLNGNIKFSAMWITKEFFAELVALSKGSDDKECKEFLLDYILSYTYNNSCTEELRASLAIQTGMAIEEAKRIQLEQEAVDKQVLADLKFAIEDGDSIVYAVEQVVNEDGMSKSLNKKLSDFLDMASEITQLAGVE